METGGRRAEFWASTPREVAFDLEVAATRLDRDERHRRWHAWHIGGFADGKLKFPSFDEFVKPVVAAPAERRRQTMEEQIDIARQWTAATSGRRK